MSRLIDALTPYLVQAEENAPTTGTAAVLASCDQIYARHLLGLPPFAAADGFGRHLAQLTSVKLAGSSRKTGPELTVHLTAYALASLRLCGKGHSDEASDFVRGLDWDWRALIDADCQLPHWPAQYSHHAWRVGHWVGGAPAILRAMWLMAPDICVREATPEIATVLDACDNLIDPRTGLLRTWRSPLLQLGFRQLYRIRHDPKAGDIGGIAHLHWNNHAEGRTTYRGADALFQRAWALMQRRPFIEAAPYCLDFDVVQIVRTSATGPLNDAVRQRAFDYAADVRAFLLARVGPDYPLHKLPGALATLHECALICGETDRLAFEGPAIDIIKAAGWL